MVPAKMRAWLTSLRAGNKSCTTSYGVNTLPDNLSHRYGFWQRMEQEFNDQVQKAPGHWRGQITSKDVPDCCVPAERKYYESICHWTERPWTFAHNAAKGTHSSEVWKSRHRLPPAVHYPPPLQNRMRTSGWIMHRHRHGLPAYRGQRYQQGK